MCQESCRMESVTMSSTNRGSDRRKNDRYMTPTDIILPLLELVDWTKVDTFLEPCRGTRNVYDAVPTSVKKYWCEIDEGRDYLTYRPRTRFDLGITNPPFSLSIEFIDKMLAECDSVIFLQRLNFLGSRTRHAWWKSKSLTSLVIMSSRPKFEDPETGLGSSDSVEYAWFCLDRAKILQNVGPFHFIDK